MSNTNFGIDAICFVSAMKGFDVYVVPSERSRISQIDHFVLFQNLQSLKIV